MRNRMTKRVRGYALTIVITGLLFVFSQSVTAETIKLPSYGFGAAAGWETGDLAGFDTSGPAMQLRLAKLFPTYPIIAVALDGEYSRLNVDTGSHFGADSFGFGLIVGTMIPFDLFGIAPANAPRGAGLPIYVGYNPIERLDFIDSGLANIDGQSLRFGVQLPTPWATLQIDYSRYFFGDSEVLPAALGGGDVDRDTVQFAIQFPVVLGWHD